MEVQRVSNYNVYLQFIHFCISHLHTFLHVNLYVIRLRMSTYIFTFLHINAHILRVYIFHAFINFLLNCYTSTLIYTFIDFHFSTFLHFYLHPMTDYDLLRIQYVIIPSTKERVLLDVECGLLLDLQLSAGHLRFTLRGLTSGRCRWSCSRHGEAEANGWSGGLQSQGSA